MHLPSISTIHSRLTLPRLLPSIGFPTPLELTENIKSFFGQVKDDSTQLSCTGVSVMIDELAMEPRPRYDTHQDTVIGLCREHAALVDLRDLTTKSDPIDALLRTKSLLDSGQCHRATEATMVAIARFGESNYNAAVILASGTCKTETAAAQAHLIGLVFDSWRTSPYGEAQNGPIWSVSTDGDPRRRVATFELCMSSGLDPASRLYSLLGNLSLLNLQCGATQITHDGDYKHEEKRLASALRSRAGIFVNGAHISPKMIVRYLRQLKHLSEQRIHSFFNSSDHQNVPKANAFLSAIVQASQLNCLSSRPENKPLVLLGHLLGAFITPYTDLTMSLAEQLSNLSKCAHLLFALYRLDSTRLISGQLYYDIQASIKNVFFCVGKTQLVNSHLPFYLLQTGDDRLESRFGTYRTCTNDRNGDLLQLSERAAAAQHIDDIFSAHPSWNRLPYRLSVDGRSGIDHTNPRSCTGDVIVGHVDLYSSWMLGCSQAADILNQLGVPFTFDPAVLHTESPDIDLMRPHGSFPGIRVDTIDPPIQPVSLAELTDETPVVPGTSGSGTTDNIPLAQTSQTAISTLGDEELSIEHFLPANLHDPAPEHCKKGWVMIKNQPVHLESAVRYLLGSDGGPKSTDRLRRVCGFTRYLSNSNAPQTDSVLGDAFHVSELVATFLRVNNQVAFAVVQVTSMTTSTGQVTESLSDKCFQAPGTLLAGQLLQLEYQSEAETWYWNQHYEDILGSPPSAQNTPSLSQRPSGKRRLLLEFGAHLARPINPEFVEQSGEHVWAFKHTEFKEFGDAFWAEWSSHNKADDMPLCVASTTFPYHDSSNSIVLIHTQATEFIQRTLSPAEGICFLCGERIKVKHDMRIHIGRHILSAQASRRNANMVTNVDLFACGFCGRANSCRTTLERRSRTSTKVDQAVSDCPFKDNFSYGTAHNSTKTNPCTNRPIRCVRCLPEDPPVWSYNLQDHVVAAHGAQAVAEMHAEITKVSPTEKEYENMRVDMNAGTINAPKSRKRQLEEPSDSNSGSAPLTKRKRN
ncbi:hypothetical protein FRC08_016445 [Ceratobasidium sp. 394]|nr:hypothetical protein FRC08_016445 [Ceratobasidium sp. 394]